MTAEQLKKNIGTLVLYLDGKRNFRRARIVHVFHLPEGVDEKHTCCLIVTPTKREMIYITQIYYVFPYFNKKIREYSEYLRKKTTYRYAKHAKR